MSLEIHFPFLLCQTNRRYLVGWTVCGTQDKNRSVASDIRKRWCNGACIPEGGKHIQDLIQHYLLFPSFHVTCFWQTEHVSRTRSVTFRTSCTCTHCSIAVTQLSGGAVMMMPFLWTLGPSCRTLKTPLGFGSWPFLRLRGQQSLDQGLELAPPIRQNRTGSFPEDRTRVKFRNIMASFLTYWTTEQVQTKYNS
jgi:hypothetical protein